MRILTTFYKKICLVVISLIGYVVCILTLQTAAFICIKNGEKNLKSLLKISYVLLMGGVMMVFQRMYF